MTRLGGKLDLHVMSQTQQSGLAPVSARTAGWMDRLVVILFAARIAIVTANFIKSSLLLLQSKAWENLVWGDSDDIADGPKITRLFHVLPRIGPEQTDRCQGEEEEV